MSTSISSPSSSFPPTRQQLDELDALLQRMLDLPVNQVEEAALERAAEAAKRKAPPAPPEKAPVEQEQVEPTMFEVGLAPQVVSPEPETTVPEPAPAEEPRSPVVSESADPPLPSSDAAEMSPMTDEGRGPAPSVPGTEAEQEEWVPLRSSWKPSAQTWPPLAEHWQQAQSAPIVAPRSEYAPALVPSAFTAPSSPPPELVAAPAPQTAITMVGDEASWLSGPLSPAESEPLSEDGAVEAPWGLLPLVWFNQGFDACVQPLGPPGRWLAGSGGKALLGLLGLLSMGAAIALAVGDRIGWTW